MTRAILIALCVTLVFIKCVRTLNVTHVYEYDDAKLTITTKEIVGGKINWKEVISLNDRKDTIRIFSYNSGSVLVKNTVFKYDDDNRFVEKLSFSDTACTILKARDFITYDTLKRVANIHSFLNNGDIRIIKEYEYTGGRVSKINAKDKNGSPVWFTRYHYDTLGNLSKEETVLLRQGNKTTKKKYYYNEADLLTKESYIDRNGVEYMIALHFYDSIMRRTKSEFKTYFNGK